jgi:hypothetical protein
MNSFGDMPYELVTFIGDYFVTLYEAMVLRHINRHWFNYKYFTIYTKTTSFKRLLTCFKVGFTGPDFQNIMKILLD